RGPRTPQWSRWGRTAHTDGRAVRVGGTRLAISWLLLRAKYRSAPASTPGLRRVLRRQALRDADGTLAEPVHRALETMKPPGPSRQLGDGGAVGPMGAGRRRERDHVSSVAARAIPGRLDGHTARQGLPGHTSARWTGTAVVRSRRGWVSVPCACTGAPPAGRRPGAGPPTTRARPVRGAASATTAPMPRGWGYRTGGGWQRPARSSGSIPRRAAASLASTGWGRRRSRRREAA